LGSVNLFSINANERMNLVCPSNHLLLIVCPNQLPFVVVDVFVRVATRTWAHTQTERGSGKSGRERRKRLETSDW